MMGSSAWLRFVLLALPSVATAGQACSAAEAAAIWHAVHDRLHALLGGTARAPSIVVHDQAGTLRHRIGDSEVRRTAGYYDAVRGELHVACKDGDRITFVRAVRHESAHHYVSQAFGRLPRWLDEGIASYIEDGRLREGSIEEHLSPGRLREFHSMLRRNRAPELRDLLVPARPRHYASDSYAASWALVFALLHHRDSGIQERRRQWLRELLERIATTHVGDEAIAEHLVAGMTADGGRLAQWETQWRREIWNLPVDNRPGRDE